VIQVHEFDMEVMKTAFELFLNFRRAYDLKASMDKAMEQAA